MKNFYIIRGLPGSGKSTAANMLKSTRFTTFHFEADMYFTAPDGTYNFSPSELKNAHSWCFENTAKALSIPHALTLIVSNTFTTKKELRPYFELAKAHGIKPQVITCQGQFGSIHNVPEDKLKQMKDRFDFKCVDELFQEYFP